MTTITATAQKFFAFVLSKDAKATVNIAWKTLLTTVPSDTAKAVGADPATWVGSAAQQDLEQELAYLLDNCAAGDVSIGEFVQ